MPVDDAGRLERPLLVARIDEVHALAHEGCGRLLSVDHAFGKQSVTAPTLEQPESVHLGPPVADEVERQRYSSGMGHALPLEQPPST